MKFATPIKSGLLTVALLVPLSVQADEAVTPKQKFHLYGGQCLKSIRLLGTYDDVWHACSAANRHRDEKMSLVELTVGTNGEYPHGRTPVSHEVRYNFCKVWSSAGVSPSLMQTSFTTTRLKTQQANVEIVWRYDR